MTEQEGLCGVCKVSEAKYKCPGCSTPSCSLLCTKRHKTSTGCSGRRNPTTFIPRSQFSDGSLNNDYNFLTRVETGLDNAARHATNLTDLRGGTASTGAKGEGGEHRAGGGGMRGGERGHGAALAFVKRAKDVGEVTVLTAPRGLSRARHNKSQWIPKRACLSWTVEWVIDDTERILTHRVLASVPLQETLVTVLHNRTTSTPKTKQPTTTIGMQETPRQPAPEHNPENQTDTTPTVPIASLTCLIRNEGLGRPSHTSTYATLDVTQTLNQALRHRTVIEFPTIWIYTSASSLPERVVRRMERAYVYVRPTSRPVHALGQGGAARRQSGDKSAKEKETGGSGTDFIAFVEEDDDDDDVLNESSSAVSSTSGSDSSSASSSDDDSDADSNEKNHHDNGRHRPDDEVGTTSREKRVVDGIETQPPAVKRKKVSLFGLPVDDHIDRVSC